MPRWPNSKKNKTQVETPTVAHRVDYVLAKPIYMELVVPPEGLILKVLDHPQKVACTLHIDRKGVRYAGQKAKKPTHKISWSILQQLSASGLLTDTVFFK